MWEHSQVRVLLLGINLVYLTRSSLASSASHVGLAVVNWSSESILSVYTASMLHTRPPLLAHNFRLQVHRKARHADAHKTSQRRHPSTIHPLWVDTQLGRATRYHAYLPAAGPAGFSIHDQTIILQAKKEATENYWRVRVRDSCVQGKREDAPRARLLFSSYRSRSAAMPSSRCAQLSRVDAYV
ncbi:hypothetical protein CGRA01v4_00754 [Colletotrichum graminicola]|nr:hypothetical protein CGRA01v4_00754 [Colletotrichum graminicola]